MSDLTLDKLKLISASNIINLRTTAGLTQAELGAKLNYSDKTISKWERGDAIPDAFVLTQLADIFGVDVNYLLSEHTSWEPSEAERPDPGPSISYSANAIMAISVLGTVTLGLAVFITLWLMDTVEWRVFLVTALIAILVYMVLDCVFKKARHLQTVLLLFVAMLFVNIYCFIPMNNPWQLFLLLIPAELLVLLSFRIRRRPHKKPPTAEGEENTVSETVE